MLPSLFKSKVGNRSAPLQLSESTLAAIACCGRAILPPSAAHSTVNFANNLFNHVYELSVHFLQVGFPVMMKGLGCKASRLGFKISASLGILLMDSSPFTHSSPLSSPPRLILKRKTRIFPYFCVLPTVYKALFSLL